jgi:hypothetical protein
MRFAQSYTINLDHVRAALNKTARPIPAAERSLGECVRDLLAAARRSEVSDAHARLTEATERELFTQAIRQAGGHRFTGRRRP